MGLGLHVANEIMKTHGGRLLFPQAHDAGLPEAFDGAVVALAFGEAGLSRLAALFLVVALANVLFLLLALAFLFGGGPLVH